MELQGLATKMECSHQELLPQSASAVVLMKEYCELRFRLALRRAQHAVADDAPIYLHDELKEAKFGELSEPFPDLGSRAWWQPLELAFGIELLIHSDEVFVILIHHPSEQGFHDTVV